MVLVLSGREEGGKTLGSDFLGESCVVGGLDYPLILLLDGLTAASETWE